MLGTGSPQGNPKAQNASNIAYNIWPLYGIVSIFPLKEPVKGNLGVS